MLLELLELASNKTLQHDAATRQRLARLRGKTMTLNVTTVDQSLSVTPYAEGLEFSRSLPDKVDVTLNATIGALIKITRDGLENAELESGELEVVGDPIIGQRFAQVIADLDVDWEGLLAEQIGESPARAVTFAAAQAREFTQQSQSKVKQAFYGFIKDDLELVADKADVETFLDDVDTLRADADRLMSRIKRLQNNIP